MEVYTIAWYPTSTASGMYEGCTHVVHDPTRNSVKFVYKGTERTVIGGSVMLIRTSPPAA